MDTMAVSSETIKALREAKAWSQAHLAEAAGVSLRTVQRMEAEGTASAETRLAVAAALDVPVDALNRPESPVAASNVEDDLAHDTAGPVLPVMFATVAAGILFSMWLGTRLPADVASHFGAAGNANGHMSRDAFVALMSLALAVPPLLVPLSLRNALRRGKINIPNAAYWLAAPRRAATGRYLQAHLAWFTVGLTLFLAYVFWRVAVANEGGVAHAELDTRWMMGGLAVFLGATTVWVTLLARRFRR
jgi:transcriptional regulator with XRE-family HTH domain